MLTAGILALLLDALLLFTRFSDEKLSRPLLIFTFLAVLAQGFLQILAGVRALQLIRDIKKGRKVRAYRKRKKTLCRPALFACLCCLLALIFSLLTGIVIWQLLVLLLTGIPVPIAYLISTGRFTLSK